MQFHLTLTPDGPVTLPLSYHGMVQGAVYHALAVAPEYSSFLHDDGFHYGQRSYKLFTFSLLEGPHRVRERRITFPGPVSLEVRSPSADFCRTFFAAMQEDRTLRLGENRLSVTDFSVTDRRVREESVRVRMRSPLCLSQTVSEGAKKATTYLSPQDEEFPALLQENFRRKYMAAFGQEPVTGISVETLGGIRKYVTRFQQNIYVTAWFGAFRLRGEQDNLDFLYQTGLGSRNSQGFGMFDVEL